VRIKGTTAAEIAGSVRDQVASGELAPRAGLPPVRVLAAELGVNRNTVALAYRRLVEAGVAETRGRGGTVVAAVPQLAREGAAAGVGGDCVDLASGNPDPMLLPDLLGAARSGEYRPPLYGAPAIDPGLDAWARADFAEDIDQPFRTLVTHGAADATERLLNAHLTRGDLVAIEDPCFLASIGTLRLSGYRSESVAVDGAGMRPDALRAALEAGARAVVCTPRAHNPTGASLTEERAADPRAILAGSPGSGDRGRPFLGGVRAAVPPGHPTGQYALGVGAVRVQVPRTGSAPRPGRRRRRDGRAPGGATERGHHLGQPTAATHRP
jgi:DNA-binding transcriptional MocR family regulator